MTQVPNLRPPTPHSSMLCSEGARGQRTARNPSTVMMTNIAMTMPNARPLNGDHRGLRATRCTIQVHATLTGIQANWYQ